jgi:hypothetical protein
MTRTIYSLTKTAEIMGISRQRLHQMVQARQIVPDYTDEKNQTFWTPATAEGYRLQHAAQKDEPKKYGRTYEKKPAY